MLVASDSESDLPVFPLLNPASMTDSHGFLHTFFRMKNFLPGYKVQKLLLDSAHDTMPYYEYCRRAETIPFIDLNGKGGASKYRIKFRCPLASRKYGCSCEHPCSGSKYGRTVHVAMKDNPRLFNMPPRDSEEWKLEYNARTSSERSNKREKIDFKLEDGRQRSTKMWYCRLYHIMMLQHLDAWELPYESALRKLILQTA